MSDDEYTFREADISDFPQIAAFFRNFNYPLQKEQWLRWKYFENPVGRGHIFLIEDSNSNIKGTLGCIPRMIINKKTGPLYVTESADMFFAPEVRGKHLFPKIKKIEMDVVDTPKIAFPNKRSEKITLQFGWQILAPLETWYFPIAWAGTSLNKTNQFLSAIVKFLAKIYASFLLIGDFKNLTIKPIDKFRHDFNKMGNHKCIKCSADYLNWRFINNPTRDYIPLEFYENEDVIGYCVLSLEGSTAMIYDFFTSHHKRSCLRKLIEYCREKNVSSLIFRGVGLKLWRLGFIKLLSNIDIISYNVPHKHWLLTLSDSDW